MNRLAVPSRLSLTHGWKHHSQGSIIRTRQGGVPAGNMLEKGDRGALMGLQPFLSETWQSLLQNQLSGDLHIPVTPKS